MSAQIVNFRPSGDQSWATRAECLGEFEDLMFPTDGDEAGLEAARQVCHRCPVRENCLSEALARGEKHGVWGGTTEDERRSMRRREANQRYRNQT